MERTPASTLNQIIDVEKVLYSKNPALRKVVPKIVINYLKKIVHQDELNDFLTRFRTFEGCTPDRSLAEVP